MTSVKIVTEYRPLIASEGDRVTIDFHGTEASKHKEIFKARYSKVCDEKVLELQKLIEKAESDLKLDLEKNELRPWWKKLLGIDCVIGINPDKLKTRYSEGFSKWWIIQEIIKENNYYLHSISAANATNRYTRTEIYHLE